MRLHHPRGSVGAPWRCIDYKFYVGDRARVSGACCSPAKIERAEPGHTSRSPENSNHERYSPRADARIANGLLASVAKKPRSALQACLMQPLFRAAQAAKPVAYGGGVQTCSYRRIAPGRSHQPRGGFGGPHPHLGRKLVEAVQGRNTLSAGISPPECPNAGRPDRTGAGHAGTARRANHWPTLLERIFRYPLFQSRRRTAVYNSDQACIRQKPDHLAGLDHRDRFAKFHQPVGINQR
jgi:hypothetical protein